MPHDGVRWCFTAPAIVAGSALVTGLLLIVLMPTLARYALARPNARSSHRIPTPQGGGMAIVAVVTSVMAVTRVVFPDVVPVATVVVVIGSMLLLAVVGAIDDIVTLRALPRLILQVAASVAVLSILPASARIVPALPLLVERAVLVIALVWFVNLVNFMDGLDWITVVEVVPLCGGIGALAMTGEIPAFAGVVSCALGGGMLGFAPFNRPVARLFLGDVGSLPIGLVLGWLLFVVACSGHLVPALILPLYYLADATITLTRRLARGERVWEAHRTHFYQRATDNGFTVRRVVWNVFITNLGLLALALFAAYLQSAVARVGLLAAASLLVGMLLRRMSRRAT